MTILMGKTALDVKDGDIIINSGHRCKAKNVKRFQLADGPVACYTLHSAPNLQFPKPLPPGFNGMVSSGNHLARVMIES